jgi:hypothetical protein
MRVVRSFAVFTILSAIGGGVVACSKKSVAPPIAESEAPVAASASPVPKGKRRYVLEGPGEARVGIDAPLEKFRGRTAKLSGLLDLDPTAIASATGEIVADLGAFETHTFGDPSKDESQTEHARNWFEIGEEVPADRREDYRRARFTIETIEKTSVASVADAPADDRGVRRVMLEIAGALRIHGRSAPKRAFVEVAFEGPPDAPSAVSFRTTAPMIASLAAHDVKPRDLTGRFLAGALEKVGKKIDDQARIEVEGRAVRTD